MASQGDSAAFAVKGLKLSEGSFKLLACFKVGFLGDPGRGLMAADEFRDNDDSYLDWLAGHTDGYVINILRSHTPDHCEGASCQLPHDQWRPGAR